MSIEKTQVLIAGGGPVGMTLALNLARRGIRCVLAERNFSTTAHPKMDITNARSMELFRTVGLTDELRRVAVPEDHCFDVSWITQANGHELHRFAYPSVLEHRAMIRARNDGSSPAESPMRVSQVEIEPVLRRAIEAEPLVSVRFGVEFMDMQQDAEGVTATLRNHHDGSSVQLRCDYLIGCDGGSSRVRNCLGIGLSGQARVLQRYMTHFRSDRRDLLMRWGRAWHYQSVHGTLIAQNDHDIYTLHTRFPEGMAPEAVKPAELIAQFVGQPIEHEVLVANPWVPHLLVADSYGAGRVWLAGDAAHQYIPTGGYGMNTGVGEAFGLGWKLASVLQGFGAPSLLEAYGIERRPVALRNCDASRRHNEIRKQIGALYHEGLYAAGAAGDAARAQAAARIAELGNAENESWGIEYGYAYRDSPIVAAESRTEAQGEWRDDPLHYAPVAVPGARLPSVFLGDGTQLYDRLGQWFTLLVMGAGDTASVAEAAKKANVPLQVLQLHQPELRKLYGAEAVLVRPDHHVAWRGRLPPTTEGAAKILSVALGWAMRSV